MTAAVLDSRTARPDACLLSAALIRAAVAGGWPGEHYPASADFLAVREHLIVLAADLRIRGGEETSMPVVVAVALLSEPDGCCSRDELRDAVDGLYQDGPRRLSKATTRRTHGREGSSAGSAIGQRLRAKLRQMEQSGLIHRDGDRVAIVDRERLIAIVERGAPAAVTAPLIG